ncbi:MAG: outer membrane protein assembly factor BamD [Thermodesulfobacteriota bacterium]
MTTAKPITKNIFTSALYSILFVTLLSLSFSGCAANKKSMSSTNVDELFKRAVYESQTNRYEEAEASFKRLIENYPLTNESLESQLMLADLYYKREAYEDASSYYASFVTLHPANPKAEYALFQKGMSFFKQVLSMDRDQKSTRKALFAFEDLMAEYPESSYVDKSKELKVFLRERLAEREFYVGNYYYREEKYRGALSRFEEIVEFYRDSTLVDKALFFIAKSYGKLGDEDLEKRTYARLASEFPESPYAKRAKRRSDG